MTNFLTWLQWLDVSNMVRPHIDAEKFLSYHWHPIWKGIVENLSGDDHLRMYENRVWDL